MKECHRAFNDWDSLDYVDIKDDMEFADAVCSEDQEPDKWQRAMAFHAAWKDQRTNGNAQHQVKADSAEKPHSLTLSWMDSLA